MIFIVIGSHFNLKILFKKGVVFNMKLINIASKF